MRKWRVGTLSMGLLLVSIGLGLLWSQFQPAPVVAAVLRWWPLLFVVLGLEVLAYTFWRKNEQGLVQYDVFSIIIIIFLIFTGVGLKAFQEAGLGQLVQKHISSSDYNIPIAGEEIKINEDVQKLVVAGGRCSHLDIRSDQSQVLIVQGEVRERAQSQAEANQQALQAFHPQTRQVGDTLFLNINGNETFKTQIIVPSRLAVEINAEGEDISLQADKIDQDWLLRNAGSTNITLPAQADLMLTVMGNSPLPLNGNIQWIKKPSSSGDEENPGDQEAQEGRQKSGDRDNQQSDNNFTAQARLGNGSHHLTLISENGAVNIKQLP